MKKHWTKLVVLAVGLVGLGLLGSTLSNGGGGSDSIAPETPALVAPEVDPYLASIDKALGRPSSQEAPQTQASAANRNMMVSPPQPAADAAAPKQGSSGTASGGTTAPTGAASSAIDDRKIVQTATISMQVKDVSGGFDQIGLLASSAGGFVASSKFSLSGDQQIASITIRVPADKYQEVLSQVRAVGAKVDSEGSNASDVTEEFSDLSAQLRNLEATETQLLTFLGQAKNITEVLQVQDRLNAVRADIERVRGRMNLLDKLSDMATISVQLRPVAAPMKVDEPKSGFSQAVSDAWESSLDFIGGIATGVATVLVFSWWIVLLGVPALLFWYRWSRHHSAPQTAGYD